MSDKISLNSPKCEKTLNKRKKKMQNNKTGAKSKKTEPKKIKRELLCKIAKQNAQN